MDSQDRLSLVQREMRKVVDDPAHMDEAVAVLAHAWQSDVQDVHESAYQAGLDGELA